MFTSEDMDRMCMSSFEVYKIEFEAKPHFNQIIIRDRIDDIRVSYNRPSFINLSTTIRFIRNETFVKHSQRELLEQEKRS